MHADLENEIQFLRAALIGSRASWDGDSLRRLATLSVPPAVLGLHGWLIDADVRLQWARWCVESFGDAGGFLRRGDSFPIIFAAVFAVVQNRFPQVGDEDRKTLAVAVARIIYGLVEQRRQAQPRRGLTDVERRDLLALSGRPPRCWICGAQFQEPAITNFLWEETNEIPVPLFLDILKPRGMEPRDLQIEVDHVVPYSAGGGEQDNLALACGWCNRYKAAHTVLYDVQGQPRRQASVSAAGDSLPQPFWIVRLLATVGRCQYFDECHRSTENSPITVAPVVEGGSMNPVNMLVTCDEHDPYRSQRFWPQRIVRRVWKRGEVATTRS